MLSEVAIQSDGRDEDESTAEQDRVQCESRDAETTIHRWDIPPQPSDVLSTTRIRNTDATEVEQVMLKEGRKDSGVVVDGDRPTEETQVASQCIRELMKA